MDYGEENYVKQGGEMTGKETGIKVRKGRDFATSDASLPLCILTKLERMEVPRLLDNTVFSQKG